MNAFLLWVAQGFGVGRIPVAPGTIGSVVGLGWFALLLLTGNFWLFLGGTVLGLAFSVWLCGVGEKILRQTDPGSIVLDEIAAIPVCFLGLIVHAFWKSGALLPPAAFFSKQHLWLPLVAFGAFRFFDILKPWPISAAERLPGGLGVMMDDVLAGLAAAILLYGTLAIKLV